MVIITTTRTPLRIIASCAYENQAYFAYTEYDQTLTDGRNHQLAAALLAYDLGLSLLGNKCFVPDRCRGPLARCKYEWETCRKE